MASPKLKNGYTPIANELLEKILEYPFKGYELKIVLKIVRDTYGWKTKKRQISYSKMAERTRMDRRHIVTYCSILTSRNIIFKQKLKNKKNIWEINKNWELWRMPDESTFQEYEFQHLAELKPDWEKVWIKNLFPPLVEILETRIKELLKLHGEKKFIDAMEIAVKQSSKKLAYIEGILRRQESGEGSATSKTQINDGRWMTDDELAKAEMNGEIYYENDKWLTKK